MTRGDAEVVGRLVGAPPVRDVDSKNHQMTAAVNNANITTQHYLCQK